jgi:flagellar hook-basal body complex protein FliE
MIDKISGLSGLSGLAGPRDTDMASAAAMPNMAAAVAGPSPSSFAETMKNLGQGVVSNLKVAEGQSFAAIRGEVPTRDVVDAIMTPNNRCRPQSPSATRWSLLISKSHVCKSEEYAMKALAIAATGMNAQQLNLEVIANNVANINTTGFKRARAEFSDLLYQGRAHSGVPNASNQAIVPEGAHVGLGVQTSAVRNLHIQGSLVGTSNKLDLALVGAWVVPDRDPGW